MAYDYLTKQRHKIGAKATVTINLAYGVNYFRVVNSGAASVYCGLSNMPTKNSYEFKVSGEAARMYAEDKLYKQIYIYNDGATDADIILYSFRAKFDPSVMALGDFAENQNKTVEVEISGFTNALPAGTNNIGKVGVESLPNDISSKLLALPNKDYTSKINNVIDCLSAIKNMYSNPPQSAIISGTIFSISATYIKLLTNDGENNMKIVYTSNEFIIKPGETITDMAITSIGSTFLNITGESGTENISGRILYI